MLAATGGLAPREVTPAPALVAAREAVDGLFARWDSAAAEVAFIPTFFDAGPTTATDLAALRAAHGSCRPEGPIDAENALRGTWTLGCERGYVDLFVSLAPTVPPRIQSLIVKGGDGVPAPTREKPGRGLLPHREGKCGP